MPPHHEHQNRPPLFHDENLPAVAVDVTTSMLINDLEQSWTDVGGDLTATSETGTSTITETLGETQVFYRIKEVSP